MLNQVPILPCWSVVEPSLSSEEAWLWVRWLSRTEVSLKGLEAGATSSSLKGDLGGLFQGLLQGPYITLFLILGLCISTKTPKEIHGSITSLSTWTFYIRLSQQLSPAIHKHSYSLLAFYPISHSKAAVPLHSHANLFFSWCTILVSV